MIRATMRHVQVLNGVIARSANSVPQFKKPMTSLLAPSVGGTLLQSKMYGWFPGSFSQPALPTAEVTDFTNDVKEDVEKAAKRRFPEYIPVLFSRQFNLFTMKGVWDETEYHVKVQTGEMDYIQVRMATEFLGARVWFNGFLDHRTKEDPIRPYIQHPGGYSDVLLATPEVILKAGELKGAVEKATDARFSEFKAVLYRVQVVAGNREMQLPAGTNYIVKVQTSSDDYVHMKMFQKRSSPEHPIEPPVELKSYKYPMTREDPLVDIL